MDGSGAPTSSCRLHPGPAPLWGVCVTRWCHVSTPQEKALLPRQTVILDTALCTPEPEQPSPGALLTIARGCGSAEVT